MRDLTSSSRPPGFLHESRTPTHESPTMNQESAEFPRHLVIASMTGIIITMFMAALDATIVGTAMPRLVAELNGFELYAAVTTVYLLATTVVVPIVGKLSDIYGRKPFLLAGVIVFIGGSALCGAAHTMTQLVLFRGL